MSTVRNLTVWVAAARTEPEINGPAIKILTEHCWGGTDFKLNSTSIATISKNMINLIEQVNYSLTDNKIVTTASGISSLVLGIQQLTEGALLNNPVMIQGNTFVPYNSMQDLGMNF